MALGNSDNSRPPTFDKLALLCIEGQEIATYLFQVPHDTVGWERVGVILNVIMQESLQASRRGMSEIVGQMWRAFQGAPSVTVTEQLMTGFDRLIALSLSPNTD